MIVGGLIIFSLALTIFVKKEFPHPGLVVKPLFVVLVIISVLVINNYLATVNASVLGIF